MHKSKAIHREREQTLCQIEQLFSSPHISQEIKETTYCVTSNANSKSSGIKALVSFPLIQYNPSMLMQFTIGYSINMMQSTDKKTIDVLMTAFFVLRNFCFLESP